MTVQTYLSTSICVDGSGNRYPRRPGQHGRHCTSKAAPSLPRDVVSYGWVYMNVKPPEAMPYRDTIIRPGTKEGPRAISSASATRR